MRNTESYYLIMVCASFAVFGLVLAGAVTVAVVAVITFGIGLAVALPLYFTTLLVAYERLFPEE